MSDRSFTTTFSVDRTPREAFEAIRDVRGWWSDEIEGSTTEPGDEFTYRFEDVHRCTIRVTDVVPDSEVSWLVLDNHFSFTRDHTEWTGTTIRFEVSAKDGRTEVRFTHDGLVPEYECFDVCVQGWGSYVGTSLPSLITTGSGRPNGRDRARTAAEEELGTARQR